MSIFDLGRPTGAMGGAVDSQAQERTNRDSDLAHADTKAKFLDYMADAELRSEARKTGIARAKQVQTTIPGETDKILAQDELATETARESKPNVPLRAKEERRQMHKALTEDQYNNVTRAYGSMQEALSAGRPAEDVYAQTRAEIVRVSPDPEAASQWLDGQGITEEYSTDAINALSGLANYGLHDAKTTRAEHLLEVEYANRKAVELAKSKALDYTVKPLGEEDLRVSGAMISKGIKNFDQLEGGQDEKGNYTGAKGAAVASIAKWATAASQRNKAGDNRLTPSDYEMIAIDMFNMSEGMTSDGDWMGIAGDKFEAGDFWINANSAINILELRRQGEPGGGVNIPTYELWKKHHRSIMAGLSAADRENGDDKQVLPDGALATQPEAESVIKPYTEPGVASEGTLEERARAASGGLSTSENSKKRKLKMKQLNAKARAGNQAAAKELSKMIKEDRGF